MHLKALSNLWFSKQQEKLKIFKSLNKYIYNYKEKKGAQPTPNLDFWLLDMKSPPKNQQKKKKEFQNLNTSTAFKKGKDCLNSKDKGFGDNASLVQNMTSTEDSGYYISNGDA